MPRGKKWKNRRYFVDYNTPVAPNLVVKLENYARGLSPQKPPYTVEIMIKEELQIRLNSSLELNIIKSILQLEKA